MNRRQLLRTASTAVALSLAGTRAAGQENATDAGHGGAANGAAEECALRECIHPTYGYVAPSIESVSDLPEDLRPDHEVELRTRQPGADDGPSTDGEAAATGGVPEFFFDPTGLAVAPGDVVQFTLAQPDHTVTAFHPALGRQRRVPEGVSGLSSPVLAGDTAWLYRFDQAGVYDLYSSPHELNGMVFRLVVGDGELNAGDAAQPDRRAPLLAAASVLASDELAPDRIVEAGSVSWDAIPQGRKALPSGLVSALGGETGDGDDDDGDDGGDDDDGDGGGDGGDDDDGDDGDDGDGAVVEQDGLRVVEHELVAGDLFATVEGVLVNETGSELGYVEVSATFYDADGNRIGQSFANTTDLAAGEQWAFTIQSAQEPGSIANYELEVSDSPF